MLDYGAMGLLGALGWTVSAYYMWRDHKRKEALPLDLKLKDKLIETKDQEIAKSKDKLAETIKELSEDRLNDLKDIIGDYNQAAANMTSTLGKLADALEIKGGDQ